MNKFEGKVILTTGMGNGTGRVLAERFAAQAAARELSEYNTHLHTVGTGLQIAYHTDASVPSDVVEAVWFLADSPLNEQIINVEET